MTRNLFIVMLAAFAQFDHSRSAQLETPRQSLDAPSGYHTIALNNHSFTLPLGFSIELVADARLAPRPIVAAFDEKGALYVCDSSGSNEPVTRQVEKKPHRIVKLEDTNGDGVFDLSTVFVPRIMFPEGAMWREGSLYVAAPPNILKFTDTDGDGLADREEIWFNGKILTGCANDLHGPYAGPDGWIYWCKGAFAKQDYAAHDGKKFTTKAAHIFRARPDGTGIEAVMTGGMDNPVDVVFTPSGERIFSTTFLQHPGGGKRDGLIHAVYGGVYGKDHDPIYHHPWTSPHLMPVMTHLGPAAPAGLHRYESLEFGKEFANNLFCCQFNMRKVSRHVLVPSGSTFTTKDSDFLVSNNLDFHPTDVIEDADGSLLVVDTGGWYKLCCPTSQLVKPDVTGAIYRVRKIGAHKIADPRGLEVNIEKMPIGEALVNLLGDPRPVVRKRAIAALAAKGFASVPLLRDLPGRQDSPTEIMLLSAVEVLTRIDHADARRAIRASYLKSANPTVRVASIHSISVWRDSWASDALVDHLKMPDLPTRRAAAEALGRLKEPSALFKIFDALSEMDNDRVLEHSLTYAVIEFASAQGTSWGKKDPARVRRAALTALDQMEEGELDAESVLAEIESSDAALRETAWWIASRHPEWGDHFAPYFHEQLTVFDKRKPEQQAELIAHLVPFLKSSPTIRKLAAERILADVNGAAAKAILRGLPQTGLKLLPPELEPGIKRALLQGSDSTVADAIAALRALQPSRELAKELVDSVANSRKRMERSLPKPLEYALLASVVSGSEFARDRAVEVIADLHRDKPAQLRLAAADLLSRSKLTSDSLSRLASALPTANPTELPGLLALFAKSTEESVGLQLLEALSRPEVRTFIRIEQIQPILVKYPQTVLTSAERLYATLAEARKGEVEKLEKILKELPTGDVRRGQLVFNGTKGQCVSCHKIGYVGGLVGPDLTRIGSIRGERDLVESIIDPSASFVRSYEPVRVTLNDGRVLTGIVKKDTSTEIVLAVSAEKDERIDRADLESLSPGAISIMPAGFDQQLTQQELADLVAFLRANK